MPADNKIQSYAHVVVLDAATHTVRAASSNLQDITGAAAGAMVGWAATDLFPQDILDGLPANRDRRVPLPQRIGSDGPVDWGHRQIIPFFDQDVIVLEIEPYLQNQLGSLDREVALNDITKGLLEASDSNELLNMVCQKLAAYLKFNRVIAYQFEDNGAGLVRNEYNDGRLPAMLNLRFRASDFPDEGYKLHERETVLNFAISSIPFATVQGDLGAGTHSVNYYLGCRTPYPIFEQFMVESAFKTLLSIAIIVDGKPWGMLFGHAIPETRLDYQLRTFAHLIGTLTGQNITYRLLEEMRQRLLSSDVVRSTLRERIAGASTLRKGLLGTDPSLLEYVTPSSGAALLVEDKFAVLGITPPKHEVLELAVWCRQASGTEDLFVTNCLEKQYGSEHLRELASGILFLPLNASRSEWIIWFRPELVEEIIYGSSDNNQQETGEARYVSVTESRRGYALAWSMAQIRAARDLQAFVRDVVMERYTHLRRVNQQLKTAYAEMEDFSYMVSHDLRAPLRGIDGFAEILLEDYGTGIGEGGKEIIQTIQYNAARMNQFIADILELSRVGRAKLIINDISVADLVADTLRDVNQQMGLAAELTVQQPMPPIRGDRDQLAVVFRQLISNAIKYSGTRKKAEIVIGFRPAAAGARFGEFFICDNGIGIETQHQQRVFGMFNRLVTQEDYAGNGVGLAIVRRIIKRHHGDIRIESNPDQGVTFLFHTDLPAPIFEKTS
ncbi:Phytochrome-like protein cph1 [Neolewinella maritima]|uniref:histidine kinase n=1 Tax=Neolewinella maritima TaxID=1383882 RepID=A0ABN8F2Q1_9BACT|nr:ATP-binding protein [Neolewinella maritima]CAH0999001.1 Phytochrome-like protein cph1 [Neolewinella maritima]